MIQDTILNYTEVDKIRSWDKHVSLKSRTLPNQDISCDYFSKAYISKSESLIICNYVEDRLPMPLLCDLCPLQRLRGIWLPVRTDDRERPVFISFKRMNKFWNWQKEYYYFIFLFSKLFYKPQSNQTNVFIIAPLSVPKWMQYPCISKIS